MGESELLSGQATLYAGEPLHAWLSGRWRCAARGRKRVAGSAVGWIRHLTLSKPSITDYSPQAYFEEPQKIKQNTLYTNEKEINFIYEFGNELVIEKTANGYTSKAKDNINIIKEKSYIQTIMTNIIEYIKFIFLTIFYVFGSLEFAIYFTRKNILHTT